MTNATFTLRRAVAADAPVLWAIRRDAILRTCRSHYPDALLQHWASGPVPASFPRNIENGYFVAGVTGGRIAGFAALKVASAEIDAVFVAPGHGRRGLGKLLLAHLEDQAVRAGLHALGLSASLNAVAFYHAAGYRSVGATRYTTSAGAVIDCVRMEKRLDATPART
jgi:GNAT superfamily N-acetyltransferase